MEAKESKKETVKEIFQSAWDKLKKTGQAFKREANETIIASKILGRMIKGKEVSQEQINFLKNQSIDLGKALAIIGVQAIPGSSVAVIALEKLADKHGFTLFPQDQGAPNMDEPFINSNETKNFPEDKAAPKDDIKKEDES
jgi:hypothetical protein